MAMAGGVSLLASPGAIGNPNRAEKQIDYEYKDIEGMQPNYLSSLEKGYSAFGCAELSEFFRPRLRYGNNGSSTVLYKKDGKGRVLKSHHLAVCKTQYLSANDYRAYKEKEVLAGVVHENIVNLYGFFGTYHPLNSQFQVSILMEYAPGYTLKEEIYRSQPLGIPEAGARFYMFQILSGLKYLHSKLVLHGAVSSEVIVIKYRENGEKVCMLCDFSECSFLTEGNLDISRDIISVCGVAQEMIGQCVSVVFQPIHLLSKKLYRMPWTVDELLAFRWFNGQVVPMIDLAPRPPLSADAAKAIGYSPAAPTGRIVL